MKDRIARLILDAARTAFDKGQLPSATFEEVVIETPKHQQHGDFATNFALVSAKAQKMAPRKIAEILVANLADHDGIFAAVEIAGPGFINFHLRPEAWYPVLDEIHDRKLEYGASDLGQGRKVQVEFVSSNPTGPLHVGHGRGAAVGDAVANLLAFCGYDVQKEYYINDSGRQIRTLGLSVWLRGAELAGEQVDFPEDCYQGDYIRDIAGQLRELKGDQLFRQQTDEAVMECARFATDQIISGIRNDLERFGVVFDQWFSEQSLYDSGEYERIVSQLEQEGVIYRKDDALWFRTSSFGDEKDRVVVRANGQPTYFASDIAYHRNKFERGFETVIDVWGADHHGYIPRLTAAVEAMGYRREQFKVILVQLVNLLRGGKPVAMSTRAGQFVTLADVIDEVGTDAARFIFLTRDTSSPLDFDLELAKQKSNDNPVYYVQYVHARICSIMAKAAERGIDTPRPAGGGGLQLDTPEEIALIKTLARYPEAVATAAERMEPHRVTFFLMDLAARFHAYYNKHRVLTEDRQLTLSRLHLVEAVKLVIHNGLNLLGVSAPTKM